MPEKFENPNDKLGFKEPRDFSRLIGQLAATQRSLYASDLPLREVRGQLVKNMGIANSRMYRYLDHLKFAMDIKDMPDASLSVYTSTGNVTLDAIPAEDYDEESVDLSYRGVKIVDEMFNWTGDAAGTSGTYKIARLVHHFSVPVDAISYQRPHRLYEDVVMPIEKTDEYLRQI